MIIVLFAVFKISKFDVLVHTYFKPKRQILLYMGFREHA